VASWSPEAVGASQSLTQTGTEVRIDPRPAKRQKATTAAWTAIREGFAGATCVHCGLAAQSLHHIVPKSQGGDDVPENLAPLCGDGTRGCHGLIESHGPGWERVVNSIRPYVLLSRPRCVYVIGKIGWDRFNARYPLLSKPDAESTPASTFASGSESNDIDELFEKPRKSPWDVDWLPDYREEDTAF
jgi:hypothetical protein